MVQAVRGEARGSGGAGDGRGGKGGNHKVVRPWTVTEEARLRREYPFASNAELAKGFGRTLRGICAKARNLKLRKCKELIERTRIKAGSDLWKRRTHNVVTNGFKKGMVPHNALPVGTVQWHQSGTSRYLRIKAVEGWRWIHRLNWEAVHGPIPEGHRIEFRNGDHEDCSVGNLVLVSKAESLRSRSWSSWSAEKASQVHKGGWVTRRRNQQARTMAILGGTVGKLTGKVRKVNGKAWSGSE